jgi:NAD(P)-dependent dehydrogenase (short-subunit alcohol dehydrogenase family)
MMFSTFEASSERQQMNDRRTIRGKAVVIIGGATEIGRASAGLLAEHGARLFVTASNPAELGAVLTEVCQWGNEVHGMVVDLNNVDEITRFFQAAVKRLGGIDILVNLPGACPEGSMIDQEICQNRCVQEGIDRMQGRGSGQIVNIEFSRSGQNLIPVTGSPQRGIGAMLRHQAQEMGIRVTTIEPGGSVGHELATTANEDLGALDIANCVLASIQQPFQVDRVYLRGRFQSKTN